jgi:GH15 family glucan-1,4-alpha-glucosidase
MKKILLLALLVLGFGMNAQKKTVDISKTEIGKLNAKHSLSIDLEKKDTIAYVYLGFQNEKYKSISDRKSILFRNQEEVNAFIKE